MLLLVLLFAFRVDCGLIFPNIANVMPCMDTVENCAGSYYGTQKNDQIILDGLKTSSASLDADSTSLFTSVSNLKSLADGLVDVIDPDNSRTNGGQILALAAGKKLVGLTPFMSTLSKKLIDSATRRSTDFNNLVVLLTNGVADLSRRLATVKKTADTLGVQISSQTQDAITRQSGSLRDYLQQMDAKVRTSASQFDTSRIAIPKSVQLSLQTALDLESSYLQTTLSKLSDLLATLTNLPADLTLYDSASSADVAAYEQNQEVVASQSSLQKTSDFSSQVTAKGASLLAQLSGLVSTDRSTPYYQSSLAQYMDQYTSPMVSSSDSNNITEFTQLVNMNATILSMDEGAKGSFFPAISGMNSMGSQINATDTKFVSDTISAIKDANATAMAANSTYLAFRWNMESLWNTTNSILSGQSGAITQALLDKMKAIMAEASAQVAELNALMISTSNDAIQADSVRQAILAKSQAQVYAMLTSNQAVLNGSLTSANALLNSSSIEMNSLLQVLSRMLTGETGALNSSSNALLANVYTQINNTVAGVGVLLDSYMSGVRKARDLDFGAMNSTFAALNATTAGYLSQSEFLIADLQAVDKSEFEEIIQNAAKADSLVMAGVNATNVLAGSVVNMSSQAAANRVELSDSISAIWNNSNAVLTNVWAAIGANNSALTQYIDRSATNLSLYESSVVSNLSSALRNASNYFNDAAVNATLNLTSWLVKLDTNSTIMADAISSASNALSDAKNTLAVNESDWLQKLSAITSAFENNFTTVENSLFNATTIRVRTNFTNSKSLYDPSPVVNNATSFLGSLESNASALREWVSSLSSAPSDMMKKAAELKTMFNSDLTDLKTNIANIANDKRPDSFNTELTTNLVVGGVGPVGDNAQFLNQSIMDVFLKGNASADHASSQISALISTANSSIDLKTTKVLANIHQVSSDSNSTVRLLVDDLLKYMPSMYANWLSSLPKVRSADELNSELTDIKNQISQIDADTAGSAATTLETAMNEFGTHIRQNLTDMILAQRTRIANIQTHVASPIPVDVPNVGESTNTLVDSTLNASQVAQAGTANVNSVSGQISNGSSGTISITSDQIAQLIAVYNSDSKARKDALQAQLAAAGKASASAADAVAVVNTVMTSVDKTASDQADDISELQAHVYESANSAVENLARISNQELQTLSKSVDATDSIMTIDHDPNMEMVNSAESNVEQVTSNANSVRTQFDQSVGSLRGYIEQIEGELTDRYTAIMNSSTQFERSIETAASNDIGAILAR